MPSGAKNRRAAKRKKQEEALAKQADGFFVRELPVGSRGEANEVEVLASNEAASVGKELEEAKRLIGENEESLLKVTANEESSCAL
ncbi:hypothetical protein K7X08_015272 [Anisodus acutangulus]|uniref:Uncharacterized protein n=1 Tax=Anisodus acutangulus TaxID=402998 RepID=A0A9Q1QWJ2_9SOLA|nr:hypothetical protein K7X08_015272 [Anisodus acutangulus]